MHKKLTLITPLFIGLTLTLVTLAALPTHLAQADDTWNTPTPTETPTAVPTPGDGTPTAVPMPEPMEFPNPNYPAPTGIPTLGAAPTPLPWATWPIPYITPYSPEPFDAPNLELTPFPTIDPTAYAVTFTDKISKSYELSYTKPLSLGNLIKKGTKGLTGTKAITFVNNAIGDISGTIGIVQSYTHWLTGEITAMNHTGTFTIAQAPDWYAPSLPREMADVGWTLETVLNKKSNKPNKNLSLRAWAWWFGRLSAMPFRFMKWVFSFWNFFGPFMLLTIWLLVMLPVVLVLRTLPILHKFLFSAIRWLEWAVDWVRKIIEMLPGF